MAGGIGNEDPRPRAPNTSLDSMRAGVVGPSDSDTLRSGFVDDVAPDRRAHSHHQ